MPRVGILALQGGVEPHRRTLASLGVACATIVGPDDVSDDLAGLILPGGESSTQGMLVERAGLGERLARFIDRGVPVLATCAGMVLCAAQRVEQAQTDGTPLGKLLPAGEVRQVKYMPLASPPLKGLARLDVTIERNGWGRQLHSFQAVADTEPPGVFSRPGRPLPLIFIRAPRIIEVGQGVEVLERLAGEPIMVRQGNLVAASFHPELTDDGRVHAELFGHLAG